MKGDPWSACAAGKMSGLSSKCGNKVVTSFTQKCVLLGQSEGHGGPPSGRLGNCSLWWVRPH